MTYSDSEIEELFKHRPDLAESIMDFLAKKAAKQIFPLVLASIGILLIVAGFYMISEALDL